MILPDNVYEVLKWVCLIALPAVSVFIMTVGPQLGIQDPEAVAKLINAVATLIGVLIGVSTAAYRAARAKAHNKD